MDDGEVAHMAALAFQLPRGGRVWRAVAPASSHSDELLMLRRMELNQRSWAWSHTKEAETRSNEPQPVLLAGEQEAHDRAEERQRRESQEVAAAFNLTM